MEDGRIIDNQYIIKERIGSGGEGVAYLVRDIKSSDPELKLVAKILEFEDNELEEEYEEDDMIKKKINSAVEIFSRISKMNPQHENIIKCIYQNKGSITKNGNLIKHRNYFIFEYAEIGDLWKMITLTGGFGERCSKPIFKKILLGVQALHNIGIYHLDLKVDNILLDKYFNPKICDFGLAKMNNGILNFKLGTKNYKPPQMFLKPIKYTGKKADIFSLGCVLFAIVTGAEWFDSAERNDDFYKYIYRNNPDEYFNKLSIKSAAVKSLTPEFKKLYLKMISIEEDDRPSIEEILEDKWFNEIKDLNDNKKTKLENDVLSKFKKKKQDMDKIIEDDHHIFDIYETFTLCDTKGGKFDDDKKPAFKNNLKPKYKKIIYAVNNHYIKIKGNLNYNYFMNKLVDNIIEKFGEDTIFSLSEYNYKCVLKFEENNNKTKDNDKKENEEDKEEDKGEDNEDDDEDDEILNENKCKIQLKLYQIGEEEFCLRFLRESGNLPQYYSNVMKLYELVKILLPEKKN